MYVVIVVLLLMVVILSMFILRRIEEMSEIIDVMEERLSNIEDAVGGEAGQLAVLVEEYEAEIETLMAELEANAVDFSRLEALNERLSAVAVSVKNIVPDVEVVGEPVVDEPVVEEPVVEENAVTGLPVVEYEQPTVVDEEPAVVDEEPVVVDEEPVVVDEV